MRPILARAHVGVIAQLARANSLVALDFDGTLAPIVKRRDQAAMRDGTRALLAEVCARYPCAVISGRSRTDVASRLAGTPVRYIVGNHGVEPSVGMEVFEEVVQVMRPRLAAALAGVQGVEVEDKRYSLAIHYRRARVGALARAAIAAAIADLPMKTRVVGGKRVVNVLPVGAPHEGIALMDLQAIAATEVALYVGDDVTDEDVFELERPERLIGVRVGRSATSAASYFIDDQGQIDALLACLIEHRQRPGGLATALDQGAGGRGGDLRGDPRLLHPAEPRRALVERARVGLRDLRVGQPRQLRSHRRREALRVYREVGHDAVRRPHAPRHRRWARRHVGLRSRHGRRLPRHRLCSSRHRHLRSVQDRQCLIIASLAFPAGGSGFPTGRMVAPHGRDTRRVTIDTDDLANNPREPCLVCGHGGRFLGTRCS